MDFYKILELNKNATKEEIKEAYKRLALKYHPDKHSQSSRVVRENATLRFKQLSEAYQILSDDRRRAEYNIHSSTQNNRSHRYGYGYSRHDKNHRYDYGNEYYSYSYNSGKGYGGGYASKLDAVFRFLTTRAFLLNIAFASALIGGMYIIDVSGEAMWKMHNSGVSFSKIYL